MLGMTLLLLISSVTAIFFAVCFPANKMRKINCMGHCRERCCMVHSTTSVPVGTWHIYFAEIGYLLGTSQAELKACFFEALSSQKRMEINRTNFLFSWKELHVFLVFPKLLLQIRSLWQVLRLERTIASPTEVCVSFSWILAVSQSN